MNLRSALAIFHCLLALTLAACGHSGNGGGNTNLRVVNAIPDVPSVSVTVGTPGGTNPQTVVSNLPFQGLTQYIGVQSGNQEFKVSANGGASNAIDTILGISSGANYTYVLYNPVASATGLLISDSSFATPASGTFGFRVINAATGVGLVDVYLTPPGTDINSTSPTVSSVAPGGVSPVLSPNAATLELRVTAAGTKQIIFDTAAQNFANGSNYQIVVYTVGSGTLVNVAFLNVDTNGTGQTEGNLLANFKVLNASQVASPLNVAVDGNLTLSNVPFAAASNYVTIADGNHTFTVQATATPGSNLLTLQTNLAAATDTSIVLNGSAGALVGTVLTDNNLQPPAGRAHIRFVNSSPNQGPLDVYVNFSKQVSGLGTNAASAYVEVTADTTLGTAFEFDFNVAGTTTPVLKMANTTIIGGHTYSIYVIGLSTGLQGVVVKDH
jgi:hypothetical protein